MAGLPLIELKEFSAYYKEKKEEYVVGLDHVSLCLYPGDFLCVVGPSGSGKSTLVKALLGLIELNDGTMLIQGEDAEGLPLRKRNFGYVSQEYSLYPSMTVYDNLAFPLRRMGAAYEEIERRVKEAAQELDLTFFLSRKPKELSGGQQQRVAIARALIKKPLLYLFDEPFSNLAPDQRGELRAEIVRINQKNKATFVFVTHDRDEALSLGSRIALMDRGEIIQIGTRDELLKHPRNVFVADFLKGSAYAD